jgi:drug/metabolite transporter (DMT)-like permease
VASALIYSLGSVLARPLLRRYPPAALSSVTMLGGGVMLVVYALVFEPGAGAALAGAWGAAAWSGWVFLVLFGSIAAYTIFLHLVHAWGPAAAGSYAFVSPVVAVGLGVLIYRETVTAQSLAGMAAMLAGAWLTLRPVEDAACAGGV